MGEPFEDNDWRRADALERQTIREYLTVYHREKSRRAGSSGSGFFVELDVVDEFGDRRKLNVSETLYINIQVGSEVMMIRYDEKCFGFYDWFDCVPRKEHL